MEYGEASDSSQVQVRRSRRLWLCRTALGQSWRPVGLSDASPCQAASLSLTRYLMPAGPLRVLRVLKHAVDDS